MPDLAYNEVDAGDYYTDCDSKRYVYVISVSAIAFVTSDRRWNDTVWSYPMTSHALLNVYEIRGENLIGPRHPSDVKCGTTSAPLCECGSDKIKAPFHSSWCPKATKMVKP